MAVLDQVRALLHQPEIVVGTWRAARRDAPELTEAETHDALHRLDPLWEHLLPAERARIVRSLMERVVVGPAGAIPVHPHGPALRLGLPRLCGCGQPHSTMAPDARTIGAQLSTSRRMKASYWAGPIGHGSAP